MRSIEVCPIAKVIHIEIWRHWLNAKLIIIVIIVKINSSTTRPVFNLNQQFNTIYNSKLYVKTWNKILKYNKSIIK